MSAIVRTSSAEALKKVYSLQGAMMLDEQVNVPMEHTLHADMYARTARLAAGTLIAGTLIKIPTLLIVSGCCWMYVEGKRYLLDGYHVISGFEGRKQVFLAAKPTVLTMIFPTKATTVAEAEAEFTDEAESLLSRRQEEACQE